MNKFNDAVNQTANDIQQNKPLILTVIGIIGFIGTAIECAYAKPKADKVIEKRHANRKKPETVVEEIAKDALAVAPVYLPAIATGAVSTLCVVGSYKISAQRIAAYSTAYSITEAKLKDYQAKVIETIGEKKEKVIREEIDAEKVKKNPPADNFVINDNETLCYDCLSGRYFRSDIETIRQAVADMNSRIFREMYISLNEFYSAICLPEIEVGDILGWNCDDAPIDINFTSCLDDKNRPCLVLSYDVSPRVDYRNLH